MANVDILRDKIAAVSDSVRRRTGMTNDISLDDLPSYIRGISGSVGHMEVASIISDGRSWINTNICPNANYTIEMRCRLTECVEGVYDQFFGCRKTVDSSVHTGIIDMAFGNTADGILSVYLSDGYLAEKQYYMPEYDNHPGTKSTYMDFRTYKIDKGVFSVDGETWHTFTVTDTNTERYPYPLYLMTCNINDEALDNNLAYMEMTYCKMWDDDGELILDLVPVLKSNGVVCLYNKVNSSYLYNQGTGTFRYTMKTNNSVTYHVDADTSYEEELVYGDNCLNPTSFEIPTKEGYTFLGWTTTGYDVLTELNMGVEAIDLYAVYSADIPVIYMRDMDDTTGQTEETVTATYSAAGTISTTFTLPRCTFTKENYAHDGWVCSIDGATYKAGDEFMYEGDATEISFYPVWMYSIYLLDPNGTTFNTIFFNSDGSNLTVHGQMGTHTYEDGNLNYALQVGMSETINNYIYFNEPIYIRNYTKFRVRFLWVNINRGYNNALCNISSAQVYDSSGYIIKGNGYANPNLAQSQYTKDYYKELTGNPNWNINTALNDANDLAWQTWEYDLTKITAQGKDHFYLGFNAYGAFYIGEVQLLAPVVETDLVDKYVIDPAGTNFDTTFLSTEGTAQSGYTALDSNNVGAAFGYANDGDGYVFTIKQWSSYNYMGFVFNDPINCADYKYLRVKYIYFDLEVEGSTVPAVAHINLAKDKTRGSNGMTANNYKSVAIGGEYTLSYYRELLGDDDWYMERALEDASNAAWKTATIDISDLNSFYLGFQSSNALFIYDAVLSNNKED